MDGSFKVDQEAARKDVERGFGVWKLKFLALTHLINSHHRDDIYYLVMATILLHNMMVKDRVSNDEIEDASLYCHTESDDDNSERTEPDDVEYNTNPSARCEKSNLVHKRWQELSDCEGSKERKDCMKRHLYIEKFGNAALSTSHLWSNSANPLCV